MMIPTFTPEKSKYCEYWQHNSNTFEQQGCYAWMASLLQPHNPIRVFDIGCGTGEGLAALLAGCTKSVVAIDENFPCLDVAAAKLEALGHRVGIESRLMYHEHGDGRHDISVDSGIPVVETTAVNLIHADLFLLGNDKAFTEYTESAEPFDAVTLWLTGTFNMRKTARILDVLEIGSPADYRQLLQDRAYRFADRILKEGGVLHVVDRGRSIAAFPELGDQILARHHELSERTSLEVIDVTSFAYEEPKERGISMIGAAVESGEPMEMHSVLSIKKSATAAEGNILAAEE